MKSKLRKYKKGPKLAVLIFVALLINLFAISANAEREIISVDFEQGAFNFLSRGGDEELTVSDEEAHGGKYSLKTTNRTVSWHGPVLEIGQMIRPGEYEISVWARLLKGTPGDFKLSSQVGRYGAASYINIDIVPVTQGDGWVQLKGTYQYPRYASDFVTVYIEHDDPEAEYYIDDLLITELSTINVQETALNGFIKNQNEGTVNWLMWVSIVIGLIGLAGIFITVITYRKNGKK